MSSKKWVALLNNAAVLVCQRCRFLNAVELLYRPLRRRPQVAVSQRPREVARLDTMEPRLLMSSTVTDYALVGQDRVTVGFQTQVSGGLIGSDQQTTLNSQVQTEGIRSGGGGVAGVSEPGRG